MAGVSVFMYIWVIYVAICLQFIYNFLSRDLHVCLSVLFNWFLLAVCLFVCLPVSFFAFLFICPFLVNQFTFVVCFALHKQTFDFLSIFCSSLCPFVCSTVYIPYIYLCDLLIIARFLRNVLI